MKSPNFIIVEAEENYNDTEDNIIVNTSIETVSRINRIATVIASPDYTILQEGDKVMLHHNILRLSNDINGNAVPSMFHISGNRYFCPLSEVLMYKRDNGWMSIDPFVFVNVIKSEDFKVGDYMISGDVDSHKGSKKLQGKIAYTNHELQDQGVVNGDKVYFLEDSEHEYDIEGKLCYKMRTSDILLKI